MPLNLKSKKTIFSVALVLGFFIPSTSFTGQAINGMLPIILFILLVDKKRFTINKIALAFLVIIYISLGVNIIIGDNIEYKSILRLFSFTALFLLFPFSQYIKVANNFLYAILIFILVSQITYAYGITPLVSFFDTYFPYEGDRLGFSTEFLLQSAGDIDSMVNRRYGGLYHNPNQAVRYVSVVLIIFLIENKKNSIIQILPFILLAFTSIILSGSRTGIVVLIVLVIMQYIMFRMKKFNTKIFLSLVFLLAIMSVSYLITVSLNLRIFDIASGVEDSIGTKVDWFFIFFDQLDSTIRLLFGHYSTDNIRRYGILLLDSEWGEVIYSFGFVGTLIISVFYISLYKTKDSNLRFCLLILLWGISSTVLFSFRMSFLFMLVLSNYYSLYLLKITNK